MHDNIVVTDWRHHLPGTKLFKKFEQLILWLHNIVALWGGVELIINTFDRGLCSRIWAICHCCLLGLLLR